MTRRNLKGSRKLQSFSFLGGIASGIATGGGTTTGIGSAQTMNETGISTATGTGEFTTTSGASGFVDSVFGVAEGNAAGGAAGSQLGTVSAMLGVGTVTFDGTTTSSGNGGFGAGFSPVAFQTITTEIPGTAIAASASNNSPKGGGGNTGGGGGGVTPPTFITTVVPVSTGPTGGFGSGNGAIDIASTTTGTLTANAITETSIGTGSSVGEATSFGGGMGSATNYFGSAGGLGSGAATGSAATAGSTKFDIVNGIFTGASDATSNFSNQGSGIFGGRPTTLAFP
jgi:hypothetical protein